MARTKEQIAPAQRPRELDLNIHQMRERATQSLVDALRAGLKTFDDIDALERLLNAQTGMLAETARTAVNGNGNGTHTPASAVVSAEEPEPAVKSRKPRKYNPVKKSREQIDELINTAVVYIEKHPGTNLTALTAFLRSHHMLDHYATESIQQQSVSKFMKRADVRTERSPFRGPGTGIITFFPKGYKATTSEAETTPAPSEPKSVSARLRAFVLDRLIEAKGPMTLKGMTAAAIDNGFPQKHGVDPINNLVARFLRKLAEAGQAKRREVGSDIYYTIKRPSLKVTKH